MEENRFIKSFNAAVEGFIYVLRMERNMRIHFLTAFFFILLGIYLNFSYLDTMILCLIITVVLVAEMLNTAVEHIVDLVQSEIHPVAKIIKDVSAGAVLVSAVNAAVVGYVLFSRKIPFNVQDQMLRIKDSAWHVTLISLIAVFGLSIIGKVVFHRGTPLRGGMPSGHASVAFSIWTIIAFLTNNSVVIALAFFMAFLIARHRVKDAIHSIWEVVAGGIMGILVTTLIFQLFR